MSHDPSEIIQISSFDAAETFLINIIIKTVLLLIIFVEKVIQFVQDPLILSLKEQHLFEIKLFCNIKNNITLINLMHPCSIKVICLFF